MDLDDELRRLFTDERLDVPFRADAEQVIVAGALRVRRRRRVAVAATGALTVAALVAVGVALSGGAPDAMPPAITHTETPTTTTTARSTTSATTSKTTSRTAPSSGSGTQAEPTTEEETAQSRSSEPLPPTLDVPVLGPTGFRALELGQPVEQARATGMLGAASQEGQGPCPAYDLLVDGRSAGFVRAAGQVEVILVAEARTPEGVGPGWTAAQAGAEYPDLDVPAAVADGSALVSVPGNQNANYRLYFDPEGVVTGIQLETATLSCEI